MILGWPASSKTGLTHKYKGIYYRSIGGHIYYHNWGETYPVGDLPEKSLNFFSLGPARAPQ